MSSGSRAFGSPKVVRATDSPSHPFVRPSDGLLGNVSRSSADDCGTDAVSRPRVALAQDGSWQIKWPPPMGSAETGRIPPARLLVGLTRDGPSCSPVQLTSVPPLRHRAGRDKRGRLR